MTTRRQLGNVLVAPTPASVVRIRQKVLVPLSPPPFRALAGTVVPLLRFAVPLLMSSAVACSVLLGEVVLSMISQGRAILHLAPIRLVSHFGVVSAIIVHVCTARPPVQGRGSG